MTTTTESPDINTANAQRRRRRATQVAFAGATGIALLAFFGTAWSGTDESTVASGQVRLVDQTIQLPQLPPDVAAALPSWVPALLQQVDDSAGGDDSGVSTDDSSVGVDDTTVDNDDSEQEEQLLQQQQDQDEANLSENNAIQSMIQSQQLAQEQNDQAEQQAMQDELQAQQDEQQANQ
jgi:hypothetical protein